VWAGQDRFTSVEVKMPTVGLDGVAKVVIYVFYFVLAPLEFVAVTETECITFAARPLIVCAVFVPVYAVTSG
jgi:hypothetical protein